MKELEVLNECLSLFSTDEQELHIINSFNDVPISLKLLDLVDGDRTFKRSTFSSAWQDIWNISVFVERMDWLRNGVIEGHIEESRWRHYTQVDIGSFHVEIRSAMDHVAEIIADFSNLNGKLPTSFNRLQQRIDKYSTKLDPEIVKLIKEASWFSDIRHVRDSLVHHGGDTLVFCGAKEGITFQIYNDFVHNQVNKSLFMYNQNVAYFEKYAALYFSHLLVFLNNLGNILLSKIPKRTSGCRSYAQGFKTLHKWTTGLRDELLVQNEIQKA